MKPKMFSCLVGCFLSLLPVGISTSRATVIDFDDLHETGSGELITPDGGTYHGLVWSNFWAVNGILSTNSGFVSGGYYGMVSASNVAFNGLNQAAEIDSAGSNFDFLTAYITGAWHSNLNVEVEGFRSGVMLYDQTVTASATSPTLFTFDYMNIDRLFINSYGGDVAFGYDGGTAIVMDNMTIDLIPEPSSLLLAVLGTLPLFAIIRHKRT